VEEVGVVEYHVEDGPVGLDVKVCGREGGQEEGQGGSGEHAVEGKGPEDGEEPHEAVLEDFYVAGKRKGDDQSTDPSQSVDQVEEEDFSASIRHHESD